MSRYEELLQQAHDQHLTQEQVISALAELIDFHDEYVKRRTRRGHRTDVDVFLERVAPALALAIELLQRDSNYEPGTTVPDRLE